MRTFTLDKNYTIVCDFVKTRSGFKHVATLLRNGEEIDDTKVCYLNRTWESFEFETVLRKLLARNKPLIPPAQAEQFLKNKGEQEHDRVNQEFKRVGQIARLGELFTDNKKDSNDWKKRMLKAGLPGLEIPEDWDGLSEEEKEERLNKIIEFCQGVKNG